MYRPFLLFHAELSDTGSVGYAAGEAILNFVTEGTSTRLAVTGSMVVEAVAADGIL